MSMCTGAVHGAINQGTRVNFECIHPAYSRERVNRPITVRSLSAPGRPELLGARRLRRRADEAVEDPLGRREFPENIVAGARALGFRAELRDNLTVDGLRDFT